MENSFIYGVNNFSGVAIPGLKNSVYDIKDSYKEDLLILEEDESLTESLPKLINLGKVADINQKIFKESDKLIKEGLVPVVFGGDHSLAIGSISASSNNYDNLGIIWVDAHADINLEETSPTGNIHGMPLSFLMGQGNDKLSKIGNDRPKVKAENIVYLGLRSVDEGETQLIEDLNIKAFYYDEIEEIGLDLALNLALNHLSSTANIHLSFDFDSMDPTVFPAVTTDVPKGFSQEDVMKIFDQVIGTGKVRSVDLVEYKSSRDENGISLGFAKKLLDFVTME